MFDLDLELDELSLLKFKDFVPEQITPQSVWNARGEYRSLLSSLTEANTWIVNHPNIDLINIETVVLPNIHSPKEEGSQDPELVAISSSTSSAWYQFIRVWYIERKEES